MTVNKTPFSINSLFFGEKNTCILTLKEKDGERIVQMIIGYLDAQPIAIELEKISKPRPWMHDLMKTILFEHEIEIEQIEITDVQENMFFSTITFTSGKIIDARPSDAILLALTCKVPIYVSEELLEKLEEMDFNIKDEDDSDDYDDTDEDDIPKKEKTTEQAPVSELDKLKSLLSQAIANEDYEAASKYRDKILSIGNLK